VSDVGAILRPIGRILGELAVGGLGLLFLIGYTAAYVPPESFWWMEPFAVLLPVLSVLTLLVAFGMWMRKRRQTVRVGLLVLVVGMIALRFGPMLGGLGRLAETSGDAAPGVLRLMTYNAPFVGSDPAELAQGVATVVHAEAPDVVALQEPHVLTGGATAPPRQVSPQLRELLGPADYRLPAVLPQRTRIRLPVIARTPLDSLSHPGAFQRTKENRFFSRVSFRWQGRRAVLYNVHLHTTVGTQKPWASTRFRFFDPAFWTPVLDTYRTGARRRAEQARRLRRMIARETDPVIVVGDFNATRHHWVYRHIADGLRDAHREAGTGLGGTFPADRPLVRIDHVLVSDHWQVVTTRVSRYHALSDHRPVVTQLRWKDTERTAGGTVGGTVGGGKPSRWEERVHGRSDSGSRTTGRQKHPKHHFPWLSVSRRPSS